MHSIDSGAAPGCHHPWTELNVEYQGAVGCCCLYKFSRDSWDRKRPFILEQFWNGDFFKKIRRAVTDHQVNQTGCRGCLRFRKDNSSPLPATRGVNKRQQDNWHCAVENMRHGREIVDSLPVSYFFVFGVQCNLNCIMCSQADVRRNGAPTLSFEQIKPLLEYMPSADEVTISGGEVFVIKDAMKLVTELIKRPELSDVRLNLISNGTLLHRHMDLLKRKRRIKLSVSLDSVGKTYEKIRVGATWRQTRDNLLLFKNTAEQNGLDWHLSVSAVVMNKTVETLPEFVDFCIQNDIPCGFQDLSPTRCSHMEDIYDGAKNISRLKDRISKATEKLLGKGWLSLASDLERIGDRLEKAQNSRQRNPAAKDGIKTEARDISGELKRLTSERIMVWGTSAYYRCCVRDHLFSGKTRFRNFMGFIDNDPDKQGKTIDGYDVLPPAGVLAAKPDVIIIASALRGEIAQQISGMGISCRII